MNGEKMKFPEEQTMQAVLIKSSPGNNMELNHHNVRYITSLD